MAQKFIAWKNDNLWTAHGWVFDIGIATRIAIERLEQGEQPEFAGGFEEMDNGNGSLMRILPLITHIKEMDIDQRYDWTKKVSSITHAHIRSVMACFYYLEFAKKIIEGKEEYQAYVNSRRRRLREATPPWADLEEIKNVYLEAQYFGMHVDHIIPLQGKNVCG